MAMKTLHVFDFDDTLVKSDARVKIEDASGSVRYMSSEEYASYTDQPGDLFDFSDFDKYPRNPKIIEPVFAELRSSIAIDGIENVLILTARSSDAPVKLFLSANKIPPIHVEAVGSSDPMRKAQYILDRLKQDKSISEVRVFEDNVRNIRTIRKTVGDAGVILKTNRVKNGSLV